MTPQEKEKAHFDVVSVNNYLFYIVSYEFSYLRHIPFGNILPEHRKHSS